MTSPSVNPGGCPTRWGSPPFDLRGFTSSFFERVEDGSLDPITVIAQVRVKESSAGDKDWVGRKLDEIVLSARFRCPGREINLVKDKNAQNASFVLETLRQCGFQGQNEEILGADVDRLLRGGTALCVRSSHQSRYDAVLARANINCEFKRFFVETVFSYNPNLVQALEVHAKAHSALLYAFGGLKYLPPAFKRNFDGLLLQAETTAAVVARFKQAILGNCRGK